jgi:LCP family protein required for cell wall assembly
LPSAPAHSTSVARHVARPSGARRALTALGTAVTLLLLVGAAGALATYLKLDSNIASEDVASLLGKDRPRAIAEGPRRPENILLIGSDTREGANSRYGSTIAGARSDTTILAHLAADRKSAVLASIPRDSIVDIPECQRADGTVVAATTARFNDAYSRGGAACTIRTVEALTQIRIDHHVVVDFNGFKHMVDALGGVEICLPKRVDDPKSNLHLDAGRQEVNGRVALAYVRTRYRLGDGSDLSRIDRQQAFLSSMVRKVSSTGLLLRPDRLVRFLDAATRSITTDPGLASLNDLRKLAQSVKSLDTGAVTFVTVPNKPNPQDRNTVVWKPSADALWSALRYDQPLPGRRSPGATPSTEPTSVPLRTAPENVRVRVLNGSGVTGAAARMAQELEATGFRVTEVATADRADYATTEVHHSPAYDESGRTLGAALPGASVVADPELSGSATLTVVVGADQLAVAPVQVAGSTASPQPEETIATRSADQDICS